MCIRGGDVPKGERERILHARSMRAAATGADADAGAAEGAAEVALTARIFALAPSLPSLAPTAAPPELRSRSHPKILSFPHDAPPPPPRQCRSPSPPRRPSRGAAGGAAGVAGVAPPPTMPPPSAERMATLQRRLSEPIHICLSEPRASAAPAAPAPAAGEGSTAMRTGSKLATRLGLEPGTRPRSRPAPPRLPRPTEQHLAARRVTGM